jgi:hypothetical protein
LRAAVGWKEKRGEKPSAQALIHTQQASGFRLQALLFVQLRPFRPSHHQHCTKFHPRPDHYYLLPTAAASA